MADEQKHEHKHEEVKSENTQEKHEHKTEAKKQDEKKHQKKDFAVINGLNLSISTKSGLHICDMIRYKKIDPAIKMVEEVIAMKRAVRMHNREVGHKKGMMGGRYPINAAKAFLILLKNLRSTAIYRGMELENSILSECITNLAAQPYKRGGAKAKRSHVFLKLSENKKSTIKKQNKGEKK